MVVGGLHHVQLKRSCLPEIQLVWQHSSIVIITYY
jgi:hypothetical protein